MSDEQDPKVEETQLYWMFHGEYGVDFKGPFSTMAEMEDSIRASFDHITVQIEYDNLYCAQLKPVQDAWSLDISEYFDEKEK